MKVLLIADAVIPVPPSGYGGTERIIDLLARELQSRGHTVNLIAKDGSNHYGGRLIRHRVPTKQYLSRAYRKLLFQILSCTSSFGADVVHSFARPDYLWGIYRMNVPLVLHFQNPVSQDGSLEILAKRKKRIHCIGVSNSQMNAVKIAFPTSVIYNATEFAASTKLICNRRKYLTFLGRLTYNKGIDTAIRVALKAGYPLRIAGNIPHEQGANTFFEEHVRPYLSRQIEWVGEIGDNEKGEFFRDSLGLLFPIRWQEPFGIVIPEALAHGVPVVARCIASTPELIRHGETGFLCNTDEEMVASVGLLSKIDPETCIADARARFSPQALADAVLRVYESVAPTR